MVGAFGEAIEGKDKIRLDLDNELEDARFFTREEVLSVLDASGLTTLTKEDLAKMDENVKAQQEAEKQGKEWDKKDDGSVANAEQGQQKDAAFR